MWNNMKIRIVRCNKHLFGIKIGQMLVCCVIGLLILSDFQPGGRFLVELTERDDESLAWNLLFTKEIHEWELEDGPIKLNPGGY